MRLVFLYEITDAEKEPFNGWKYYINIDKVESVRVHGAKNGIAYVIFRIGREEYASRNFESVEKAEKWLAEITD